MSTVSLAELHTSTVELLPQRETLSFISRNRVRIAAYNTALAVSLFTLDSQNIANAGQTIVVYNR